MAGAEPRLEPAARRRDGAAAQDAGRSEARNRRLRSRLTRRLLDDPIVYNDELSEAERAYLTSQRAFLLAQIEEATGLVPEVRREGIALAPGHDGAEDEAPTGDLWESSA